MFNVAQLSGFVSAALMLWSGTNLALDDYSVHTTGVPALQSNEKPVARVQVDVDAISEFETYYLNEINPFVPYSKRVVERRQMRERNNRNKRRPPTEVPKEREPVKPPQPPVALPKLVFEPLKPDTVKVPQIVGNVATADAYLVFVRLGDKEMSMKPGDKIDGWTMVEMKDGQVEFKDPDGESLRINVVNGAQINEIASSDSGSEAGTGSAGGQGNGVLGQAPKTMNQKQMIELLKDPVYAEAFKRQLKSDPNMKKMLMDPTVLRMLREAGLEHIIK